MPRIYALCLLLLLAVISHAATCTLTVLGPDGNAVTGARVVTVQRAMALWPPENELTTDAAGQVQLQYRPPQHRYFDRAIVYQPGFGVEFVKLDAPALTLHLASGLSLHGKLVDPNGAPVSGVKVQLTAICQTLPTVDADRYRADVLGLTALPSDPSLWGTDESPLLVPATLLPVFSTETDANGEWRMADVPAGGEFAQLVLSQPRYTKQTVSVSLPVNGAGPMMVMQPATSIAVHVKSTTGIPVRFTLIQLFDGQKTLDSVNSDERGICRFAGLPPGTYRVALSDMESRWIAKPVEGIVTRPWEETTVDLVLAPSARIDGQVLDAETKKPVKLDLLVYSQEYGKENVGSDRVTSGTDGRFEISALPGAGVIEIAPSSVKYGYLAPPDVAGMEVELKPGETTKVTVLAQRGKTITGIAVNEAGEPAAGVPLSVTMLNTDPETEERRFSMTSDADGRFSLLVARFAPIRISLDPYAASNEEWQAEPLTVESPDTEPITFTVRHFDMEEVSGRVVDTEGNPVPDVTVELRRDNQPGRDSFPSFTYAHTDSEGMYTARRYAGRGITLQSITKKGYLTRKLGTLALGDTMISDSVLAKFDGTLSGTVVDATGKPVAGATVLSLDCALETRVLTGTDGAFSLTDIPQGDATILAVTPGAACVWHGQAGVKDAKLRLQAPQAISLDAVLTAWQEKGYPSRVSMAAAYLGEGWDKVESVLATGDNPVRYYERTALLWTYLRRDPARAARVVVDQLPLLERADDRLNLVTEGGLRSARLDPEAAEACYEIARSMVEPERVGFYGRVIELAHTLGHDDEAESMVRDLIPIMQATGKEEDFHWVVRTAAFISTELVDEVCEAVPTEWRPAGLAAAIPYINEYDTATAERLKATLPTEMLFDVNDRQNNLVLNTIRILSQTDPTASIARARALPKGVERMKGLEMVLQFLPQDQVLAVGKEAFATMPVKQVDDYNVTSLMAARMIYDLDHVTGQPLLLDQFRRLKRNDPFFFKIKIPAFAYAAAPVDPLECRLLLEWGFQQFKNDNRDHRWYLNQYAAAMMALDPQRALAMAEELPAYNDGANAYSGMVQYLRGTERDRLFLLYHW